MAAASDPSRRDSPPCLDIGAPATVLVYLSLMECICHSGFCERYQMLVVCHILCDMDKTCVVVAAVPLLRFIFSYYSFLFRPFFFFLSLFLFPGCLFETNVYALGY